GGSASMTENLFAGGEVGIRLLPNVERLAIEGNSFVENQQQVEVAGSGGDPAANRWHANHWRDSAGYDANGDGGGDVPYRAERLFEQVVDRRPALRFFLLSPATTAIDFAARAFPLFRPQAKLEDDAPRLAATLPTDTPAVEPTRAARLSWP